MKKLFALIAAVLLAGGMMAEDGLVYTLMYSNAEGAGNAYAQTYDVTINGIMWNVPGNATMDPARIGGKNLDGVDRVIYSMSPIPNNISKIEIEHGTAADVTVNSMTVIVASDAEFANVISSFTPEFAASATVSVSRPDGADWSNAYYKIAYNITISANSNKFIQFKEARFFGEGGSLVVLPDTLSVNVAQAIEAGMALDSAAISFDVYEVTGYVVNSQPYNHNYKNQIWFMADDAENAGEQEFEAYACTVVEEGVTMQVLDGDKVKLVGKLSKYYNATDAKFIIEIKNGVAEFIEKAEGDHAIPELKVDTITVARAIELGMALANSNDKTPETYIVKGFACTTYAPNEGYTDQTWYMHDTDPTAFSDFQAFQCQPDYLVEQGDYMYVKGQIMKYVKNDKVTIEISRGTAVHGTAPYVQVDTISASEAKTRAEALEVDGREKVAVLCYVANIKTPYSAENHNITVWLNDDPTSTYGDIQAYRANVSDEYGPQVAEHDKVLVVGYIAHTQYEQDGEMKDSYQIEKGAKMELIEKAQGIENIVLTEDIKKVVVDGVVYIVRDGKMFDVRGAQVR